MLNDAERAAFEALRLKAKEVEVRTKTHEDGLEEVRQDCVKIRNDYQALRLEALMREMQERNVVCCTRCEKVTARQDATYIFVESCIQVSCGYENSCYSFEGFRKLFRSCPTCAQTMRDRHGWRGEYDVSLKKQPFFYAFSVEQCEDGFYMSRFGEKIKLSEEQVDTLGSIPESTVDLYAKEWGLPPKLQYRGQGRLVLSDFQIVPV